VNIEGGLHGSAYKAAILGEHHEVVEILQRRGADPNLGHILEGERGLRDQDTSRHFWKALVFTNAVEMDDKRRVERILWLMERSFQFAIQRRDYRTVELLASQHPGIDAGRAASIPTYCQVFDKPATEEMRGMRGVEGGNGVPHHPAICFDIHLFLDKFTKSGCRY